MPLKFRALKAFLAAVETGSITRAAAQIGLTQPSLTTSLKNLERDLGVTLFDRTTRSLRLTAAGQEFLARIERPVADLDEAYRHMRDLSEARLGSVVVGALPSCALALVPSVISRLKAAYPNLGIRLIEAHDAELAMMLRTNQVEFGIASQQPDSANLDFEYLLDDTFMLLHPPCHPITRVSEPGWADLVSHDLILLSKGSNWRAQFESAVSGMTAVPGARFDVTHMATAVHMVRQGLGLTVVPRLAQPALHLDGLAIRPLAGRLSQRRIGILYRPDRSLSSGARHLIALFREAAGDVAESVTDRRIGAATPN
jgi:LysR family carnitine catabolism transcriptional activator